MCCHSQLRNLRNMVVAKVTETATLTLVRANKSPGGGHWSDHDYDVYAGGRVIGRIMLHPTAARGRMIRSSVNSPGCVSTSIEPPCCLTMMS